MIEESVLRIRYVQYGDELVLNEMEMPLDSDELTILCHVFAVADPRSAEEEELEEASLKSLSVEAIREKLKNIGISEVTWTTY